MKKELTSQEKVELITILKARFEQNMVRHKGLEWSKVQVKLEGNPEKLWILNEMEKTGGEPDVVIFDDKVSIGNSGEFIFCDCSTESPKGRRSLCYDRKALDARKLHKPKDSVLDVAANIGVELLSEKQYRQLQVIGNFDLKTSSWVETPAPIRKLGGALYADRRYDTVFIYHNGADSYYAARGFRGLVRV